MGTVGACGVHNRYSDDARWRELVIVGLEAIDAFFLFLFFFLFYTTTLINGLSNSLALNDLAFYESWDVSVFVFY